MSRRLTTAGVLVALTALLGVGLLGPSAALTPATETGLPRLLASPDTISGTVLDLDGMPIAGARVTTGAADAAPAVTGVDGSFHILAGQPTWVTVRHDDFLARTRAAAPGEPTLIRLTPDDGQTASLLFAGDVMMGRRFYEPSDGTDPLLTPGNEAAEQQALLAHVAPLLQTPHLTTVNLETPLTDSAARHPTKPFNFVSAPVTAHSLAVAGIDVVGLANNHLYDALDEGVADTLAHVDAANLSRFGAGPDASTARGAVYHTANNVTVAWAGCTTITGSQHAIDYVAHATGDSKGGAAACNEVDVEQDVAAMADTADIVVFQIHGGTEYSRDPTALVTNLTARARAAGAHLVINHHPHVVGGLDWDGESLAAWSLGNFVFDQTVWPTFESYALEVHVRPGEVIRAFLEPIMIEGFTPKGITGDAAHYVATGAAGRSTGAPAVVEAGAMELDLANRSTTLTQSLAISGHFDWGTIVEPAWVLQDFLPENGGFVRAGRDALWVGGFDDTDVDQEHLENRLWSYDRSRVVAQGADTAEGNGALQMQRSANNTQPQMVNAKHRLLLAHAMAGAEVSVIGHGQATHPESFDVQLSWYNGTRGSSFVRHVQQPVHGIEWTPWRMDSVAPAEAVAVGLFFKAQPPVADNSTVDLDATHVVVWEPEATATHVGHTHLRVHGHGIGVFATTVLPGGAASLPPAAVGSHEWTR